VTTDTETTLAGFLLARIAEDEAAARRLLRYAQENELAVGEPQMLGRRIPGWHEWPDVQAMCSHVLAECAAKRRIVARHSQWERTLRDLGAVYADHPDYRDEWRP
jgi:hypothetical protein